MKTFLGADVGGTFIKLGLARGPRIAAQEAIPTAPISSGPRALEEGLVKAIREMVRRHRVKPAALGVGVAGLVLYPEGVVLTCANLKGWDRVPLKSRLQRRLGIPVQVDNDANVMALAEWRYGAGRGTRNLLCVTLGTGVGGGLILDGRLYRSRRGPSAEIGHMAVGEEGPLCSCGGKACLERYVGNKDLLKALRRRLERGARSKILRLVDHRLDRLTPEVIDRACKLGDRVAIETWEEAGEKIGLVLAKTVNLLSPDRIVIGGGISKAGHWLFGPIRRTLRARAMRSLADVPVVPARLGSSAGLMGAALLGQEALRR